MNENENHVKELRLNVSMSKNIENTENLFFIGDNLDCLKILKKYYEGKIRCICIDPPYNTQRKIFVYSDKFDINESRLSFSIVANENSGDYMKFEIGPANDHYGWINFLYPRIALAKDLLSEDGVIFISIDDREQTNLRLICDHIFGEKNFVACFVRKTGKSPRNDAKRIAIAHDYVLCYSKNVKKLVLNKKKSDVHRFKYKDEHFEFRGHFTLSQLDRGSLKYSEKLDYPLVIEEGRKIIIFDGKTFKKEPAPEKIAIWPGKDPMNKTWIFTWSKEKVNWGIENDFIVFRKMKDSWRVYYKAYELVDNKNNVKKEKIPYNTLLLNHSNDLGSNEIKKILGDKHFDYPKPVSLIKHLLKISTDDSSIVLDFFAGSGTTGEAVMRLNAEDGGKRKFILIQIDEAIKPNKTAHKFCVDNGLPPTIASIAIERLKRAGEMIKNELKDKNMSLWETEDKRDIDIGFKTFNVVERDVENNIDALSRVYNMIFDKGLDDPSASLQMIVENCVYKINDHYYVTNVNELSKMKAIEFSDEDLVFIDKNYKSDASSLPMFIGKHVEYI